MQDWTCADQRLLRRVIPENRLRVYDVRKVIDTLADAGSVLEIRRGFGLGMVTALARIEGRPLGIIANNPTHLAGAIDSPTAPTRPRASCSSATRSTSRCCSCATRPASWSGPRSRRPRWCGTASRMFVTGANLSVPFFTIVLRKGYGLGAQAMAGGSFKAPFFTVSWPTGEFGGMGLEGAVKLGYRKELEAIDDPAERTKTLRRDGRTHVRTRQGVSMASHFEIDDVIDPAESRRWIVAGLRARRRHRRVPARSGRASIRGSATSVTV